MAPSSEITLKNPIKVCKYIMIFLPANPCTCTTAVLTHIRVLIFPRNPKDPFIFKKMNFNSYIPPSDDNTYDQEVFQHFLQRNQVTSVSNPEYSLCLLLVIHNLCHFSFLQHLVSKILILHIIIAI